MVKQIDVFYPSLARDSATLEPDPVEVSITVYSGHLVMYITKDLSSGTASETNYDIQIILIIVIQ